MVNVPLLDSRSLPGYWHPVGLFTPDIQAVGAALPGMPGILVGRTKHVAFGVTNAYGDVQDVYYGHTHKPQSNFLQQGLRFHNTGATLHGVRSRIQTFLYDPADLERGLQERNHHHVKPVGAGVV